MRITADSKSVKIIILLFASVSVLTALAIFFCGPSGSRAAGIPTLPAPRSGSYSIDFTYPPQGVLPGDFNGDGVLDFVARTWAGGPDGTIWIEARLSNGTLLWNFDTGVVDRSSEAQGPTDISLTTWDFDGNGVWEVYFTYQDAANNWHHRIVEGLTGNVLADNAFPIKYSGHVMNMAQIAYRGGIPRIVSQSGDEGRAWMFETWTGSKWSLAPMWAYSHGKCMAHDMIATIDADENGSDDEIFAGTVVLNSDGSVRYDLGGGCPDHSLVGYFSSTYRGLVYVTGDSERQLIQAVRAADGSIIWRKQMTQYFSNWGHWHSGYLADVDPNIPGAELFATDKGASHWIKIRVEDGAVIDYGTGYSGVSTIFKAIWDDDSYYDNAPDSHGRPTDNTIGQADIGGSGTEELFWTSGKTFHVEFNNSYPAVASRWSTDRHYRQDVESFASGYAAWYRHPVALRRKPGG